MKRVILIGAGGHHKVIKEMIQQQGDYEIVAVLDERFDQSEWDNGILYGPLGMLPDWLGVDEKPLFIIAIGLNEVRQRLAKELEQQGARFATAVHPSAVVSSTVTIGDGSVIMANAVVQADAVIGRHVIVNIGSIVEHDCMVGDYAHLSSGCILAGGAAVGGSVYLKPGTAVMQNERIKSGSS